MNPEFGYSTRPGVVRAMECEVTRVLHSEKIRHLSDLRLGMNREDLAPDWRAQILRSVAPCLGTKLFEWRRVGQVATLGELFMCAGKHYDARIIYYFYRTLRIVVTKRPHGGKEKAPDRAAIRDLLVSLLTDLRPPWAEANSPQALPGECTLVRLQQPCFLSWSVTEGNAVFGDQIMEEVRTASAVVGLAMHGILARPLYVCTGRSHGKLCMRVAAMSPLVELCGARKRYWWRQCTAQAVESGADNAALRILHLYQTVLAKDGKPTLVRSQLSSY